MHTLTIQTTSHSRIAVKQQAPEGAPKKPRGERLEALRAYMNRGNHLRDRNKPLTPENLKYLREIAEDVGYARVSNVSRVLKREYPAVALVMNKHSWLPNPKAPKKERLFRYIEQGQHLRDPEGELSAVNLKYQHEIAEEVGGSQQNICELIQENFPHIAAVMTNRNQYDRND